MSELRAWLHRNPQPITVRFERADGEERTLRIGVARSKWRDAESALAHAVKCEAFAEDGALLRVWEAENVEETQAGASGKKGVAAEPSFVEYARIYNAGCDAAVQRYEAIVGRAFDQQGVLVATLSGRLAALEKAWHELLMSQQPPETDADPNQNMVTALLGAALSAGPPAAPPPANGKKK